MSASLNQGDVLQVVTPTTSLPFPLVLFVGSGSALLGRT